MTGSLCPAANAADRYVAPDGKPANAGTEASPWDIESTLRGDRGVRPGDTVYLLPGTYRRRPDEQFDVKLTGTEREPVHVRGVRGRRVTIDGGLRVMEPSRHLWIRDLEILVSEPHPEKPVGPGSHPPDFKRPWGGLNVHAGKNNKYIHLVIHDCRQGVSWWLEDADSELYGCVIYDNGWPATDRGHGHAVYTQNKEGTKTISDNIMTGGHAYTLHAYGSDKAYVDNYLVRGNICYAAGGPFLVGGGRPSRGIEVEDNVVHGSRIQVGYTEGNHDCQVRNNIVINGDILTKDFRRALVEGNRVFKPGDPRPRRLMVLRPSTHDRDRANLAVWNPSGAKEVPVGLVTFLNRGDRFRLMNPRDLFGKPVTEGEFQRDPVAVPMAGEFAAFVILREPRGGKGN